MRAMLTHAMCKKVVTLMKMATRITLKMKMMMKALRMRLMTLQQQTLTEMAVMMIVKTKRRIGWRSSKLNKRKKRRDEE